MTKLGLKTEAIPLKLNFKSLLDSNNLNRNEKKLKGYNDGVAEIEHGK